MLNKFLPPGSPARNRLRHVLRRLNFSVTQDLRDNFSGADESRLDELREVLTQVYFPSWFSNIDPQEFLASAQAQHALENHMYRKLDLDRFDFIPWVNSQLPLAGARVLEIGCGTGCSTVSLAEQGAIVTAMDVHAEALEVAKIRCNLHALSNVDFVLGNAANVGDLFAGNQFDLIVFFEVLEHMTIAERRQSLAGAWQILGANRYLCITKTPNRLWFSDGHTSRLPFFHWLPDELAFDYSMYSPLEPFNQRFREVSEETMLRFAREGRGVSYHELDLALNAIDAYSVSSDLIDYIKFRNPAIFVKRWLAGDAKRERLLNSYAPTRHRGFFRENLNLLFRKHG